MRNAVLALVFVPGTAWADLRCATANQNFVYTVNEAEQTVTLNDLPAFRYSIVLRPIEALLGRVYARVQLTPTEDNPVPNSHNAVMWLNFGPGDAITLHDNFSVHVPSFDTAFAPVEEILQTARGVPCSQE